MALVLAFFYTKKKKKINETSGIDKSAEWSTLPVCLSLKCFLIFFFNRADTEGTNSSKILCLMFVYVCFFVGLCRD